MKNNLKKANSNVYFEINGELVDITTPTKFMGFYAENLLEAYMFPQAPAYAAGAQLSV